MPAEEGARTHAKPAMSSNTALGRLSRLYPILDAGLLGTAGISIENYAHELHRAGIRFLQYRDKNAIDAAVLEGARLLRTIFRKSEATLLLNDRVHLCAEADFDGVHLGQEDLSIEQARVILGRSAILGISTHTAEQLRRADATSADYVAIGPVYPTASKENPDPAVGIEGVAAVRRLTAKPLVAIGGITPENSGAIFAAGADAVAVISSLLPRPGESSAELVRDFLHLFR